MHNKVRLIKVTRVFQDRPFSVHWECGHCKSRVAESRKLELKYCPVCGHKFGEVEERVSS